MVLIKRFIFGSIALIFIAMGGFGTQSNNLILQCGGVIGIIIGLVVIYIFGKMAWRAMGCIPSLLVLIIILLFVLYAIGGFTDGIGGVGKNVQSFFGHGIDSSEDVLVNMNVKQEVEKTKSTELDNQKRDDGVINLIGEDEHPILTENFLPKQKKKEEKSFNPMDYPAMEGVSNVLTGDTLVVNGRVIKLFGVAAPDISQTCADEQERGYRCGQQSIAWLKSWLADNMLKCHILNEDKQGVLTGVCLLGQYDIGAAIINAGWAVANINQTKIYLSYQNQASQNKRGLWQGRFYMPWDWQKIKTRRANIKIIKPKSAKKSAWSNLF